MQTHTNHRVDEAEHSTRETTREETDPAVAREVRNRRPHERAEGHHTLDADVYDTRALTEAGA